MSNPYMNLVGSFSKDRKKPALLLALPFVVTGGADTVFLQMAKHLAANGFDLSIVTTVPTDPSFGDNTSHYEAINKQFYHLHRFLEDTHKWKDFLFYLIESRNIEILLLAGSVYVYDLLPEIKKRFPKLKVADHLFNEFGHIQNNRKYAHYFDAHIVVNNVVKQVLTRRFGEDENKIHLIIHGIDVNGRFNPDSMKELAPASVSPSGKFIISFIGRFSEEKCPERFVDIANLLRDEANLLFLMLGNGPQYPHIRTKISDLGLEKLIQLLGNVDDVRPYLAIIGSLVIPSNIEGIPLTLMEALSLGIPVVASDVGGVSSVIQDGFNGFICKPTDIEGFASKIKRLANDPGLRAAMSTNAREYALEHLSVDRMNRQYQTVFRHLLGLTAPASTQDEALTGVVY